jgi:hypothetical protein
MPGRKGGDAMPRRGDPDQLVLEADGGRTSQPASVRAAVVSSAEFADRAASRTGAAGLDEMVENMPGLGRQARDRERAYPRDVSAAPRDPRLDRRLPRPGSMRKPLSSRQRKARSVSKRATQDDMPQTQYEALSQLASDPAYRARINDALSAAAGDVQQLPEPMRAQVQRTDRAVQAYERLSGRGHVVYANLEIPLVARGGASPLGLARSYFPEGSELSLDRFTGAAHSMHETEATSAPDAVVVLEIQTRRGMYLGRSDSLDDTAHLLPRGMRLRVVGDAHEATYQRPDKTTGRRTVLQVQDIGQPDS